MAIKIGTIDITGVAVGETSIGFVAIGSDIVWQRVLPDPLCFTNVGAGQATITIDKVGNPDDASLEYSTDGTTWTPYTFSDLLNIAVGGKVYFRASGTNDISFNKDGTNYYRVTTGIPGGDTRLNVSGNINTLFKKDGSIGVRGKSRCFRDFFNSCNIVDASQLELPSTTLALQCYYGMFQDNTFLSAAPALPSTVLASSCYRNMFRGCTSLKSAPALPVTFLNEYCYSQMFQGCTSLTDAPELPATTLVSNCYSNMFQGCSSLSSITVGFSDWKSEKTPTANWVNGVASTGEFHCPDELSVVYDASHIPENWALNPTPTKVKYTVASGFPDWEGDIVGELSSTSIPNITYAKEIETGSQVTGIANNALSGNTNITDVTIGDSVTRIGAEAFRGSGLSSLSIGNGVTGIGAYAFRNCSGLTSVTIPSSVTNIGNSAFGSCSNLMSVTFSGKDMATVQGMARYSWGLSSGCVLHCSDGDITL